MITSLTLPADYFPGIHEGWRSAAIYLGYQDVSLGDLTFVSDEGKRYDVDVWAVVHKTLGHLTDDEAQLSGSGSTHQVKMDQCRLHPECTRNTEITIVKFYYGGEPR